MPKWTLLFNRSRYDQLFSSTSSALDPFTLRMDDLVRGHDLTAIFLSALVVLFSASEDFSLRLNDALERAQVKYMAIAHRYFRHLLRSGEEGVRGVSGIVSVLKLIREYEKVKWSGLNVM